MVLLGMAMMMMMMILMVLMKIMMMMILVMMVIMMMMVVMAMMMMLMLMPEWGWAQRVSGTSSRAWSSSTDTTFVSASLGFASSSRAPVSRAR